jgi:hypothetical protein
MPFSEASGADRMPVFTRCSLREAIRIDLLAFVTAFTTGLLGFLSTKVNEHVTIAPRTAPQLQAFGNPCCTLIVEPIQQIWSIEYSWCPLYVQRFSTVR